MNLKEIPLAEGDVPGFDINHPSGSGRTKLMPTWLDEGYDGVHFIGKGVGRTHLRAAGWDGATCVVGMHNGIVRFSDVTVHAGYSRAFLFGLENKNATPPKRKFHLMLDQIAGVVDPPTESGRTKWWLHHYNADVTIDGAEIDATLASEHAGYGHSCARLGHKLRHVKFVGSGAEQWKVRSPASECAWGGKNAWIDIEDCEFANWYQSWSDRGGCAVNAQGAGMNLRVSRSIFRGGRDLPGIPGHLRSRAIMVTSESASYNALTGAVGTGAGNGYVVIEKCAVSGGPGTENYSLLLRVGKVGGTQKAARGVLIDSCGMWGERMQFQYSDLPKGSLVVRNCNTQTIRDFCNMIGMDTRSEAAIITSSGIVPMSEGFKA